jgi:hypothetical protein
MVSAMGRLEKSVDAHKSDILVSKISKDGSSIMTGQMIKLMYKNQSD